ncbi:bacteriohopanetetrol glucosamine biosynthesis glycosyltransferase HpnI [Rhodopila sp.]|uniref:bacteriohopanetetrol glucosamine biosynthesis glycosyltransferase HpnI n=1 Tax=Rhodopila sp. TaxID=2480087 RepID=UPI003D0D0A44
MIGVLAGICAVLTCVGLVQALVGSRLVASFAARTKKAPSRRPPVTVLKPLYGDEPALEAALATFCRQCYPDFQIVFGVQDQADSAVGVVARLRVRFPDRDITLVVDPTRHGSNLKVGNLINMFPTARHDILVIADSDVHVGPDYLERLIEALARPGVGLVTTLYRGFPVLPNLTAALGAMQITQGFLPGALLSRAMGRRDCLGATMCLRRDDLIRIGGLHALVNHLADDNVLGQRIGSLGLDVVLADTVPLTSVPEVRLGALFRHELRWARTIRTLEPIGYPISVLQYPLFWALLAMLLAGSVWSLALFCLAWLLRALVALRIDSALAGRRGLYDTPALAFSCPVWLLPVRDVLSLAVLVASYGGRRVDWRGHDLLADTPPPVAQSTLSVRPIEEVDTR